ncbi:hypothetical protein [Leptospira interrogans]|uniref:hypothetical protein n=1 Tax=Leptospira interrogans TaxID=173 RepID=UPI000773BE91|nr:hypothetical protein [Leptospira interrogans]MBE0305399.1 hypothetical protein [Leptospira interrogans serovar Yeoncheon]
MHGILFSTNRSVIWKTSILGIRRGKEGLVCIGNSVVSFERDRFILRFTFCNLLSLSSNLGKTIYKEFLK